MHALWLLVPNHVLDNFPRVSSFVGRHRQLLYHLAPEHILILVRRHHPCQEASQYTIKLLCMSSSVSIGAVVNWVFNSWKLFSHDSVHLNSFPFYVRDVMGLAIFKNPSINRR
jgi:hypothetical protein